MVGMLILTAHALTVDFSNIFKVSLVSQWVEGPPSLTRAERERIQTEEGWILWQP